MIKYNRYQHRRGTMIPLIAVSAISLFAFVALAVDLGMLAVSRTQCQNAADASALAGCRVLNNKINVTNSNLTQAVANAKATATSNIHLSATFTNSQIAKIEAGQYLYDPNSQLFKVNSWSDVTTTTSASPVSGSWTALRVTMSVTQPTYFMKVFGVTAMPTGATATAVYRPRDVAFVLDMTGSMAYASSFNYNGISLNSDNLIPTFGHYGSVQSRIRATANQANGSGEAMSQNNFTVTTPGGPPIVRCFYFDPANAATPTNSAFPVTVSAGNVVLKNAFHRWSPPETPAALGTTTVGSPTYDFTGYNAFHNGTEGSPKGPTPAPDNFGTMTDSGSITYVGDRWRRADGSIDKANTTWSGSTKRAAAHAAELLGYAVSGTNICKGGTTTTITSEDKFRDPVWEANGYDLDIAAYRTWKSSSNNGNPGSASSYTTLLPVADRFVGYSMGPGYWGKTFFIWPPDPRAPVGNPGDTSYKAGDWRRRYFKRNSTTSFSTQSDSGSGTDFDGINEAILNSSVASGNSGAMTLSTTTSGYVIDYTAVLRWIKSGPQVLPPNLRAGRVLYYTSIPNDVDTSTGSDQVKLDKTFWKNYIDYVLGYGLTASSYLYGRGDSWTSSTTSIYTGDLNTWNGPSSNWTPTNQRPYMRYNDSPNRPRLHFWFGPLSMMDFLGLKGNWLPGTCTEAQCWQLKAGMNSVLDDVRNNHPNDYTGLVMFAADYYNGIRRPMSQNYSSIKNALFYPRSLLDGIDGGDVSSEFRPYDVDFTDLAPANIPNANGSTDPNTGLAYAYNLLSSSSLLASGTYTSKGRRGASKIVIFETDGVPNTYRGLSSGTTTMNPTLRGYDTFYPDSTWSSGNIGNGDATCMSEAVKVVRQIVKPVASTNGTGTDSGMSLPNAPARVYPIGFGDIFDSVTSPGATFRDDAKQFLANIAAAGNTGETGATTIPDTQIITGTYQQRIDRLKDCMQRIFQSGVAVVLIE